MKQSMKHKQEHGRKGKETLFLTTGCHATRVLIYLGQRRILSSNQQQGQAGLVQTFKFQRMRVQILYKWGFRGLVVRATVSLKRKVSILFMWLDRDLKAEAAIFVQGLSVG